MVGAVLALVPRAAGDVAVTLRSWARVQSAPITLTDVADVRGEPGEAARVGAAVVLSEAPAGEWITIDIDMVRGALEASGPVNWGRVSLSGSRCAVRVGTTPPPKQPKPAHATATDAASGRVPSPDDPAPAEGTLRALVIERLGAMYAVGPADLRVVFDPGRDSARLDQPLGAGETTIIEPGASTSSGRVPVRIDVYQGDRILRSLDCGTRVEVRRPALVALRTLERGDEVGAEAVGHESRWVSPGAEQPLDKDRTVGSVARRRVLAGGVITAADVQAALACARGDEVWVHVLSGELRMRIKARALANARDGEMVKLQVDGSKKCFEARMSGRGVAVVAVRDGRGPLEVEGAPRPRAAGAARADNPAVASADEPIPGNWDIDANDLTPEAPAAEARTKGAPAQARAPKTVTVRENLRDRRSPSLRAKQEAQSGKEKAR